MKNLLMNTKIYILLLILFLYKGVFINIISNINALLTINSTPENTEINILKENINYLEEELNELTTIKYTNYNYELTRLSYRSSYTDYNFYVYGSFYENYALVNENGLVGIINKSYDNYSECTMLPGVTNLSVNINNSYGTLSNYIDNEFIITNISNYDDIKINDQVYTSTLGTIKERILIGYVSRIESSDIEKTIYVKSNVDFNNITYLYVVGEK